MQEEEKDIRLAIFVPTLMGGGTEHVMVTLANGIAARGFPVDLIVANSDGPNAQRIDGRVNLVDLGKANVASCILPLARYLKRTKLQAILSAMPHSNNAVILARWLSGVNTRVVISERTSLGWEPENSRENFHFWLRKKIYRYADSLILVAHEELELAIDLFGIERDKVTAIYNPVITPELLGQIEESPEHPWLREKDEQDGKIIVAVGRLDPIKGYDLLLNAFAKLRDKNDARLIIFGEGPNRVFLEGKVANLGLDGLVSLPGFIRNPVKEIKASDMFVLSSIFEGLPSVLVQALACRVPIVSTNCKTGPSEILQNGKWGALTKVGDVDALAQAMENALFQNIDFAPTDHLNKFSLSNALDAYLSCLVKSAKDDMRDIETV